MKAVIVDLQGKYAAALDETGSVVRIPDAAYRIGQEIELHTVPSARLNMRRKIAATAAAAVLVLGLGTGTAYALPCGTVSLDAASSIEYTVNCFNYVLDVKGADEEAETVLSEIGKTNLRHRPITQAIETTVEQIREDGWLDEEGSSLQIRAEGRTNGIPNSFRNSWTRSLPETSGCRSRMGNRRIRGDRNRKTLRCSRRKTETRAA